MVNPQITIRNMEMTDAIRDYAALKIGKYASILDHATHIVVEITELTPHKGVAQDFAVEINVKVPGTLLRVGEKGEDAYALIDKVTDQLARKVKRYQDKRAYWEGSRSLKDVEMDLASQEQATEEDYPDNYQVTLYKIDKKIKADVQPISAEEAIERMELAGGSFWYFKNIENGVYTLVYKRIGGGYGLIEPAN